MLKRMILTLALLALGPVHAGVVFDNTDGNGPDGGAAFGMVGGNFVVDDFILSEDTVLSDVHFWVVSDAASLNAFYSSINYVFFQDDGSGHPDIAAPILDADLGQNVTVTATGEDPFGTGGIFMRYKVDFDLARQVVVSGDTTYWLGLTVLDPGGALGAAWETTSPGHGNPAHVGFPPSETNFEMAYYLTSVPLPTPLLLMAIGLVGIARRAKR